jgi:hypothetical protein
MADEMRAHLEMRVEDLVAAGAPRSEAERRARMEFGSIDGTTMDVLVGEQFAAPRFRAVLVALFGAVALCLALAGIYGVMAYTVA